MRVLEWQECQGRGVLEWQPDLWDRWQNSSRGLIAKIETVINHAGEDTAEERADPVHAVVGPVMSSERGAKGAGWVHRSACKRASEEDVHRDRESNGKACDLVERSFGIGRSGENDPNEEERGGSFE